MIKKIVTIPDPILKKKCLPADVVLIKAGKFEKLCKDLADTLRITKDGAGLAAPQIGESVQICVIGKDMTPEKKDDLILINPIWQKMSLLQAKDFEGCLSVPRVFGEVKRYKKIRVQALDRAGKPLDFVAKDFFARVIQHEVDHLNGILFIEKAKNLREAVEQ